MSATLLDSVSAGMAGSSSAESLSSISGAEDEGSLRISLEVPADMPLSPFPAGALTKTRETVETAVQTDSDAVVVEMTERVADMEQTQAQLLNLIEEARVMMRRLLTQYQSERQTNEMLMQKVDKSAFATPAEYNRLFMASLQTGTDASLPVEARAMIGRLQTVVHIAQGDTTEDDPNGSVQRSTSPSPRKRNVLATSISTNSLRPPHLSVSLGSPTMTHASHGLTRNAINPSSAYAKKAVESYIRVMEDRPLSAVAGTSEPLLFIGPDSLQRTLFASSSNHLDRLLPSLRQSGLLGSSGSSSSPLPETPSS